jgi:hypothetical protein
VQQGKPLRWRSGRALVEVAQEAEAAPEKLARGRRRAQDHARAAIGQSRVLRAAGDQWHAAAVAESEDGRCLVLAAGGEKKPRPLLDEPRSRPLGSLGAGSGSESQRKRPAPSGEQLFGDLGASPRRLCPRPGARQHHAETDRRRLRSRWPRCGKQRGRGADERAPPELRWSPDPTHGAIDDPMPSRSKDVSRNRGLQVTLVSPLAGGKRRG